MVFFIIQKDEDNVDREHYDGTTGVVAEWVRPKVAKGPRFKSPPNPGGANYLAKKKKR